MNVINERIQESIDVKKKLVEDMEIQSSIERVARVIQIGRASCRERVLRLV